MRASVVGSRLDVASSRSSTLGRSSEGPGEGDALALAAREADAPLADHGLEAVRQLGQERRHLGQVERPSAAPRPGVAADVDVVAQRVGEEEGLLEDERRVRRRRRHLAGVGHEQAGEHGEEGRLPGRGRTDDGDGRPRGDVEVDVVQHVPTGLVGEADLAGRRRRGRRTSRGRPPGRAGAVGPVAEDALHPVPTGQRVRQVAQREADDAQRPDEEREQVDEAGDVAEGRGAGVHPGRADQRSAARWRTTGRRPGRGRTWPGAGPGGPSTSAATTPARAGGRPRAPRRRRP